MNDSLLAQGVQALKVLGLNYAFVLDVSERQAFVRGMFVTVQLALLTIAGSLAAGVALAAALTSGRAWLARPARAFVEVTRNTRSEEHTSELQSQSNLVCRLLLEK